MQRSTFLILCDGNIVVTVSVLACFAFCSAATPANSMLTGFLSNCRSFATVSEIIVCVEHPSSAALAGVFLLPFLSITSAVLMNPDPVSLLVAAKLSLIVSHQDGASI